MSEVVRQSARESITSVARRNRFTTLLFSSMNIARLSASVRVQTAVKHMADLSASREGQCKDFAQSCSSESRNLRSDGTWLTLTRTAWIGFIAPHRVLRWRHCSQLKTTFCFNSRRAHYCELSALHTAESRSSRNIPMDLTVTKVVQTFLPLLHSRASHSDFSRLCGEPKNKIYK